MRSSSVKDDDRENEKHQQHNRINCKTTYPGGIVKEIAKKEVVQAFAITLDEELRMTIIGSRVTANETLNYSSQYCCTGD